MPAVLARPNTPMQSAETTTIDIALLNNYSDAGLECAERQILDALDAASGDRLVRLRLFSLPTIERSSATLDRLQELYTPFDQMLQSHFDGVFVTGAEPRAACLQDETFWPMFTDVVDWAASHTRSTIYSCLAAHGAAFYLDDVERHRLSSKCSGVFPVERIGTHPLTIDLCADLKICHSRWNTLASADLMAAGYQILTRGPMGVDMFAKVNGSQFLFFQGHPEYEAHTLAREYRRDVLRFLTGETTSYPDLPADYCSRSEANSLLAFRRIAERRPMISTFAMFPELDCRGPSSPRHVELWRNWLALAAGDAGSTWQDLPDLGIAVRPGDDAAIAHQCTAAHLSP